ncbi:MAG: D-glycerate dehydrogenase [Ignavibacteriales bacterium]|nr:D-glycerate dehydrogenase [Ignavibacteriales bacterium]
MKIFITKEIPEAGINHIRKSGISLEVYSGSKPITKKTLIEKISDVDGIITLLSDKVDKDFIDSAKHCKIIANYAVGFNNIDVNYAKQKGIIVTNTPDVLTDSTADLAISLMLCCARNIVPAEKFMRTGKFTGWQPKLFLGMELKGKTFGILGAGRIGTATAVRAHSFGMKIVYYSNHQNLYLDTKLNGEKVSLDKLLSHSNVISIHLPLNKKTFNLLSEKKLKLIHKNSILINTARGEIVDEVFLIKMLNKKLIYAAGFDVYQNEPSVNSALLKLENAVLLPHLGSATIEARNAMSKLAARNVVNVLKGKKPLTPIQM